MVNEAVKSDSPTEESQTAPSSQAGADAARGPASVVPLEAKMSDDVAKDDEARRGFIERSRSTLRQVWKGWTRGSKGGRRIAQLEPDLPEDELQIVRRHIDACLSGRGGDVSARARAADLGRAYLDLTPEGKSRFFDLLVQSYGPDRAAIHKAAARFVELDEDLDRLADESTEALASDSKKDLLAAQQKLNEALQSPRIELLKQFNSLEQGIKFLVDMRADFLGLHGDLVRSDPDWTAFDRELRELLTAWFDVGFLSLTRITWDAPASLLEKLVRYEAVHAIRGTEDMRNRLQADRRCYAFFHPAMPNEPLIFVEVALLNGIADNVQDLLNQRREAADPEQADTAIFYSISNAQAGLAGVGFGDFLIKRVVRELSTELPKLKTFATLSPIPGFGRWLEARLDDADLLDEGERAALQKVTDLSVADALRAFFAHPSAKPDKSLEAAARPILHRLCAVYLTSSRGDRKGRVRALDPVAHFHLSNGARIERLNWKGDRSRKGVRQSAGMMVNYLYKLSDIERNHEAYTDKCDIKMSNGFKSLL